MKNRLSILLLCCFIVPNVYAVTPMVAGDGSTSLYLKADGTIQRWGGYNPLYLLPVTIPITGVTQINNSFLKNDGTVWNLGSTAPTWSLIQVGISNVQKISGAHAHTLALKSDGTVWAWGDNQIGELGIGQITYTQSTPVQAIGLTNIVDISAGGSSQPSSYALMNNGTVWAWGSNESGQFGNGGTCGSPFCGVATPTQIPGLSGVKAIAAGYTHTVILKTDGTVWVTGDTNGTNFIQVSGLNGIKSIAAGRGAASPVSSLALKNDGTVWSFSNSASPTASVISGLSNIQSISISDGGKIFYAVAQNGTAYDWGYGYLGDGQSINYSSAPVTVGVVTVTPPPPGTGTGTGTASAQVPALSELGGMIMGALLLLISLVVQKRKLFI